MWTYSKIFSNEMIFSQCNVNCMKMKLISLIVIFPLISPSLSMGLVMDTMNKWTESADLTQLQNIFTVLDQLSFLNSDITNLSIMDNIKPTISLQQWQTSEVCKEQMDILLKGIKNGDFWTLTMLDASAKLESGLFYGNQFLFGNYDECLEIEYRYIQNNKDNAIKGQYCTVATVFSGSGKLLKGNAHSTRQLQLLLQSTLGLCVPSGCSVQDLQNISKVITKTYLNDINIIFTDGYCSTKDTQLYIPSRSVYCIIIFALIGFLIVIGTLADVFNLPGNTAILRCFSVYTNGKKLFTAKQSEDNLYCLNGMRVLSMMLIVLGHRFLAASSIPAVNKIFIKLWVDYWYNYFFIGLGFVVDTFFTISGLLIVYLYKRALDCGKEVNWTMFILHRFLRLTPSLAIMILFYSTMMTFFEPAWSPVLDSVLGEACRKHWWKTLLYIQNYWNPSDMCVVQSWYLAVDTQLHIMAPVLLIILKKFPRPTIVALILIAVLSMAAAFEVTWLRSLGATYLNQEVDEYTYLYTPTHMRVSPWLFGAITGNFIANNKNRSISISKISVCLLWILSLGTLIFVLLFQKFYHDNEYNSLHSSLFNTFSRPLWGAAICQIIILCVFNHGGVVNWLLSSAPFTFLIRINYSIYLVHTLVISIILSKTKTTTYLSVFSIVHETLGDYCIILVIATFWTLAFESPFIALEKLIFSKGQYNGENFDRKNNDLNGSCETVIMR